MRRKMAGEDHRALWSPRGGKVSSALKTVNHLILLLPFSSALRGL